MFIMVDGITGSGKTTVIQAMADWLASKGQRIFDLKSYCEERHRIPEYTEVPGFDVYATFEPTRAWIGEAIREELSFTKNGFETIELAQAFALDRHVLYRRLVLPALANHKHVLQDRGFITSLAYQTQMKHGISEKVLMKLPGNALAAEHLPDHLILTDIEVETALARLQARNDKSRGVFTDKKLLERVRNRYKQTAFLDRFRKRGTRIHWLDTAESMEQSKQDARALIASIFETH